MSTVSWMRVGDGSGGGRAGSSVDRTRADALAEFGVDVAEHEDSRAHFVRCRTCCLGWEVDRTSSRWARRAERVRTWSVVAEMIGSHGRCALVTVAAVRGSAPREPRPVRAWSLRRTAASAGPSAAASWSGRQCARSGWRATRSREMPRSPPSTGSRWDPISASAAAAACACSPRCSTAIGSTRSGLLPGARRPVRS